MGRINGVIMRCQFLGGAEEVGQVGLIAETPGGNLLFDYGFVASDPPGYPEPAPPVDHAFLSHAHVDHSGMIPWLVERYGSRIVGTTPTRDVSTLLAYDSYKICMFNGYPQPYNKRDIAMTKEYYDTFGYGETAHAHDLDVILHSAGHIPGSTMFEVRGDSTFVFTGDINTMDTQLVSAAKPVSCETLFLEGTYSGRTHPDRKTLEHEFLEKVDEVVSRGGRALIPAFAVGRTQEILLILNKSGYDIRLDGMGKRVLRHYLDNPEFLRDRRKLQDVLSNHQLQFVKNQFQRESALDGEVIITTSGMLQGGPILSYIRKVKDDPKSAVLLTGYQVEGTNGRNVLERQSIMLDNQLHRLNCEVEYYDFSAHAGHDELLGFVEACDPDRVVLFHSQDRSFLAEDIRATGKEVLTPLRKETFEI